MIETPGKIIAGSVLSSAVIFGDSAVREITNKRFSTFSPKT